MLSGALCFMHSALRPMYSILFLSQGWGNGNYFHFSISEITAKPKNDSLRSESLTKYWPCFPQQYSSLQSISSGRSSQSFFWLLMKEIIAMLYKQVWIVGRIENGIWCDIKELKKLREMHKVLEREPLKSSLCWCLWFWAFQKLFS